jgi:hypothetical protein
MYGYFLGIINNTDVLVTVDILQNSITDINRDDIIDAKFAIYHGNNLKIIKIIDELCNEYSCFHFLHLKKLYSLNEIINHSVQFFLSKERTIRGKKIHSKYTGKIIKWYDNGNVHKIMNFKNGWKDGYCQENWSNGKQKFICEYKRGEVNGIKKLYDEQGNLIEIMYFVNGIYENIIKNDNITDKIPTIFDNEFL